MKEILDYLFSCYSYHFKMKLVWRRQRRTHCMVNWARSQPFFVQRTTIHRGYNYLFTIYRDIKGEQKIP